MSGRARLVDGELLPPSSLAGVSSLAQVMPGLPYATCAALSTVSTRHRAVHGHDLRYWSHGGATDLGNLVLVCGRHHTLVHQHGFQLQLRADRGLTVTTADGVPVLHRPALPWADPEAWTPRDTSPRRRSSRTSSSPG